MSNERVDYMRQLQDEAWKRGYEACYAGEQKHSPYSAPKKES